MLYLLANLACSEVHTILDIYLTTLPVSQYSASVKVIKYELTGLHTKCIKLSYSILSVLEVTENTNSPLSLQLPSWENEPYQLETLQLWHRFPTLCSISTFLCIICNSPVSTATVNELDNGGLIPNRGVLLCHKTKTDSGDHSTFYSVWTEGSSHGVKDAGMWSWSLKPSYCWC
jgi:hypothetical protein